MYDLKNMSDSEIRVMNYIIKNSNIIFKQSINDIADNCFVSKSTVVRTAKKMGYNGLVDLKYDFKNKSEVFKSKQMIDYNSMRINDINNTIDHLSTIDFNSLAYFIYNKKIYFFGKGLNESICEYAVNQLLLFGLDCTHLSNTHVAYETAKHLKNNSLVFILSATGETSQCLKLANKCIRYGVPVVSLTGASKNTLADLSDKHYYIYLSNDSRVDFDNTSRVPMLLFFHCLMDSIINNFN